MTDKPCKFCDGEPGSPETYEGQVCLPIRGRVQCIDHCIHHIVAALNAANVVTTGSCCGHGKMPGNILLEDGRALIILPEIPADMEAWSKIPGFPPLRRMTGE
ncbi:MAG: hypothetical protein F4Y02_06610 [Chloroflexi bacterium]|nr:hypothetical protein [Chloroflexota bacterium]